MYMGFYSDTLPTNNVTDYLVRVVKPKLDSIEGVQTAEILGARLFALRAWLDPDRMAAHGVTASDVSTALATNNYLAALGTTKGQMVTVDLTAGTDLHSVDEFKQLVVKQSGRRDRAPRGRRHRHARRRELRLQRRPSAASSSVFIGIKVAPEANILDVAKRVRKALPGHPAAAAHRPDRRDRLRRHRVHQHARSAKSSRRWSRRCSSSPW